VDCITNKMIDLKEKVCVCVRACVFFFSGKETCKQIFRRNGGQERKGERRQRKSPNLKGTQTEKRASPKTTHGRSRNESRKKRHGRPFRRVERRAEEENRNENQKETCIRQPIGAPLPLFFFSFFQFAGAVTDNEISLTLFSTLQIQSSSSYCFLSTSLTREGFL
jgi:hypothetical protein